MLNRLKCKVRLYLRHYRDKVRGIIIGKNVKFDLNTYFEGKNYIYENSRIWGCFIGYGTYIQSNALIAKTKIGRFCSIGSNFNTVAGRHPVKDFISTHPSFYSVMEQSGFTFVDQNRFEEVKFVDKDHIIDIGSDVFIGVNVTVLDGVTIGHGAVIGAGTTVYKNIEPYAIYAGNPMRLIRYRFEPDVVQKLLETKWWDHPVEWLQKNAKHFDCPKNFFGIEGLYEH